MANEVIPLMLVDSESKVFVNQGKAAVTVRVSAIAQGIAGEIGIGTLRGGEGSAPVLESSLHERIALDPVGRLIIIEMTVEPSKTIHVVPGAGGTVAIRGETSS
jgi:hypothetical protein